MDWEDIYMIESIMNNVLGNIDPMVLYICAGVLVITFLLALIKKVISIVIITGVLVLGCLFLVPQVLDYQANFSVGVNEDNQLEIMVDGKSFSLGGEESDIVEIVLERRSDGWYDVKTETTEGSRGSFPVPGFMRSPIVTYLERNDTEYKIIE